MLELDQLGLDRVELGCIKVERVAVAQGQRSERDVVLAIVVGEDLAGPLRITPTSRSEPESPCPCRSRPNEDSKANGTP